MTRCGAWGIAVATSAFLVAAAANAQPKSSIALDQLEAAPAGDAFVGVPSPYARGDFVPRLLAMIDFAHEPLLLSTKTGTAHVVDGQTFLLVNASFAIQDRLLISALLPVAVAQSGDDPKVGGVTVASPNSAAIGDLRVGLRVRMLGDDDDPFQAGLGAYLHLPTAKAGGYVGEGTVREVPHLAVGGRFALGVVPILWTAMGGVMVRDSSNPSMLTYGAGIAASLLEDRLTIGPEFYASTPLQSGTFAIAQGVKIDANESTNAELLGDVRARLVSGLVVGASVGPGLSQAIGTPSLRFVGSLGWSPEASNKEHANGDSDGDGIPDTEDACPFAFGPHNADPKKNGCPVLDDDEDGIPNSEDACPQQYGVRNADPKKNGCPPPAPNDTDGDGIPDSEDACPNEKGVPSSDPKKNGCPTAMVEPDSDGDGIPDSEDACPHEKGPRTGDPSTTGCLKSVRVRESEIATLAPIAFVEVKAKPVLELSAEAVLDDVREALVDHPEIAKVEIQGHTDGRGTAKVQEATSSVEAELVRAWLIAHGIASDRLVAKGYGSSKPIADDKTPEGRAKNQRIAFVIVERR